jgi:hypothetical protein
VQAAARPRPAAGRRLRHGVPHRPCRRCSYLYALPVAHYYRALQGLRRYGFHGTSHRYVAFRGPQAAGHPSRRRSTSSRLPPRQRLLVACAIEAAASSFDTSMGFTPLEGLVMGTRSGDLDPSIVPWLADREGLDPAPARDHPQQALRPARHLRPHERHAASSFSRGGRAPGPPRHPRARHVLRSVSGKLHRRLSSPQLGGCERRSSSPAASARTPPRSAPASARSSTGLGSRSTPSSTRAPKVASRSASRPRTARSPRGSSPRTKNS